MVLPFGERRPWKPLSVARLCLGDDLPPARRQRDRLTGARCPLVLSSTFRQPASGLAGFGAHHARGAVRRCKMTISPHITSRGKAIHILSPGDLMQVVESGERLRAICPVHGGDHQRSLSIDRATGWGFCHCCHATVLVEALSPTLVFGGEGRLLRKRAGVRQHPATITPDWQREEVAVLQAALPLMREALASSRRAQRYLDERGIPLVGASAAGIGYLSPAVWEKISTP